MAINISKVTDRIVGVTRRGFLGKAGTVLAVGAATVVPQQTMAAEEPLSLEQMACALHEIVGRYSELHVAPNIQMPGPRLRSAMFVNGTMEMLRGRSVNEIQCILKPLIGGAS